jgi:hypothetical protein
MSTGLCMGAALFGLKFNRVSLLIRMC